jgi:DUF2971 family protein
MAQPMNRDEQIEQLHAHVNEFKERCQRRIVNEFPSLRARLSTIAWLLATVDLNHLSAVPIRFVVDLGKVIQLATECVSVYMMNSYDPEIKEIHGAVPPPQLSRNRDNIRVWESRLDETYADLYAVTAGIVTHQQARLARVAFASRVEVDTARSDLVSAGGDTVWRYMPLNNLIRCEAASGIWFSSLQTLKTWSERGIVDTHEGEVPPMLENLKREYDLALIGSDEATERFCNRYGILVTDIPELDRILSSSFEPQNLFVSSWSRKRKESSSMWTHYGDDGRGIAIRSQIGKLMQAHWKIPIEWSGAIGPHRFSGLLFRSVKYLNFDETDKPESVQDLYLPFLKRAEFEEEHEVRIVGFTNAPAEAQGLSLLCNLADIIEEIVVGPHGNLDQTKHRIELHAADLRNVPLRKSSLAG